MSHIDLLPLVSVTCGPLVENQHFGVAVVADTDGRVMCSWGNPGRLVFARSSLKPMQALPAVESGATARFGFGPAELALMCSSHSGEPQHVSGVKAMLARIGLDESNLQCGVHVPIYYRDHAAGGVPPLSAFSALAHNCSGKHAGFLAHAWHVGASIDDYLNAGHPTQVAVREAILRIAGMPGESLVESVDGCSAPTYAMLLVNLATAYAGLATAAPESAFGMLREAMMAFPNLVSGTGRTDDALMGVAKGRIVAKAGADGIQAVGLPGLGLGVAVKIASGDGRAAVAVTLAILQELVAFTVEEIEQVRKVAALNVTTTRGATVGEWRVNLAQP